MRWVSLVFQFGVRSLVQGKPCVSFQDFGGIRSTQPTGLKRFLKLSMFRRRIRFGCKPNLPDLGVATVIFLKLTLMVRLQTEPTGLEVAADNYP